MDRRPQYSDRETVGLAPSSAYLAARPLEHDQGVTAPNPHAPKATANRAAPLQAGAWSMGRGLRVRVVDSLGRSLVWG